MSIEFWAGVLLSGIVGFPVAIITNLYSDQVRDYLDRRRVIKLNKMRALELQTYQRVLGLVEGDPTQTLLLGEQRHMIGWTFLLLYLFYGMIAVLFYFRPEILSVVPRFVLVTTIIIFLLGTSIISLISLILFDGHRTTMRKVRRFPEYEAQIREKWGDDAI
jgi:hypothetical protein